MKKFFTTILVAAVLIGFAITPAAAYPDKPVTFVVPWPPGDFEDILTRMIAEEFQKEYGVPAAVVNKPGGGGGPFPGAVYVAKAPPDGSIIGSFVISVPTIGPQIGIPELNPDPFEPLGIFMTYPFVIVASKNQALKI
jgi:tripartite-type tricarboxylate transporter receptor subunit TctC